MRPICLIPFALILACTESTTDVVPRYAVLDDVGESNWTDVTVGRDHTSVSIPSCNRLAATNLL